MMTQFLKNNFMFRESSKRGSHITLSIFVWTRIETRHVQRKIREQHKKV